MGTGDCWISVPVTSSSATSTDKPRYVLGAMPEGSERQLVAFDPESGCTLEQLCPCEGPRGQSSPWQHQRYLGCVSTTVESLVQRDYVIAIEADLLMLEAEGSECGVDPCKGKPLLVSSPSRLRCTEPSTQPIASPSGARQISQR